MTSLAVFICSLSGKATWYPSDINPIFLNKLMDFVGLLLSLLFCYFLNFLILLVTVKWDKCIPVLNSYPTHSFPVGFCAGVLSPKGSRMLCFSVSCSQTVLCVLILVET